MNDAVTAVVLVRPREEGNVGAAARAMANMGLRRLILVEPAAELGGVARAFAVGAREILDGVSRVGSLREALAPFPRVVATTSTRDRRQAVPLIGPRELPARLAADPPGTPLALVFGPEVGGLTNDELAFANLVVTIPCAPEQPTLNLAQAVLLLAYEIHQAKPAKAPGNLESPAAAVEFPATTLAAPAIALGSAAASRELPATSVELPATSRVRQATSRGVSGITLEPPATTAEVDGLFDHLTALLQHIGFDRDATFAGVLRDLRAAAARARLASREVAILRGICRRAQHALLPERKP